MYHTSTVAFILLVMSIAPASLSAKGDIVKIKITGVGLTTPIEITDPKIKAFNIWAGPGVSPNGVEQTEGFIIEWSKGVVAQLRTMLQRYEVSFYEGCEIGDPNCQNIEPSLVYVVSYAYNPSTGHGFVYLPGRGNKLFKFNGAMLHGHGLEGNWFRATSAWDSFVRPFIARTRATRPKA